MVADRGITCCPEKGFKLQANTKIQSYFYLLENNRCILPMGQFERELQIIRVFVIVISQEPVVDEIINKLFYQKINLLVILLQF